MGSFQAAATLLLLFTYCAIATQVLQKCTRDADCSGPNKAGYFCLETKCEHCVPCGITFNRSPPATGCARTEDECGLCLPGYTSNDLTHQRRSTKCFLINALSEGFLSSAGISSFAAGIFGLAVLIGLVATAYITNRKPSSESNKVAHRRNPPPYEEGSIRMFSHSYQLVDNMCERGNGAVPILESPTDEFAEEGSTETIPSLWEPRDEQSSPQRRLPLAKCQSLDLPHPSGGSRWMRQANRSQSEPVLNAVMDTDGSRRLDPITYYRNQHVLLSVHRLQERFGCSMDPIPPLAFPYVEDQHSSVVTSQTLNPDGRQDSGFFDNTANLNLSVTFYFKRRRDSE